MNQSIPSENHIYSNCCRLSIFFLWLTAHFVISNKSLLIKSKYTIFVFLPIGHRSENISYRSISSVQSSSKIHIFRLLICMYIFFGSFRLIQSPPFLKFGMIELIVGFLFLLHSYKSTLKIVNNSGRSTNIVVSFLERKKINAIWVLRGFNWRKVCQAKYPLNCLIVKGDREYVWPLITAINQNLNFLNEDGEVVYSIPPK